jgi:hypothetical protein
MSADNGIYVCPFYKPGDDKKKIVEWRVAHAQAIESIDDEELGNLYTSIYFSEAKVFKSREAALAYAHGREALETVCEYGVCVLSPKPLPMPLREAEIAVAKWEREHFFIMAEKNQSGGTFRTYTWKGDKS